MNRGDRPEPIFEDDTDRKQFIATLSEACAKTNRQVYAYCLVRCQPAYFRSKRNIVSDFRPNADWILSSFGYSAGVMIPGMVSDSYVTRHLPLALASVM